MQIVSPDQFHQPPISTARLNVTFKKFIIFAHEEVKEILGKILCRVPNYYSFGNAKQANCPQSMITTFSCKMLIFSS